MTVEEETPPIRFGPYRFDAANGELTRGEGDDAVVTRLAPQPARLLAHLVRRRPRLVGHEEIRRLLWPDVTVEFEQSLHTCVRQIRAALGDDAAEPRYVETMPRRGYRFVAPVEGDADIAAARRRRRLTAAIGGVLAVALLAVAAPVWFGARPRPPRIAVMPFEPLDAASALATGNDLAESLVARLVAEQPDAEIVGPTTTRLYDGPAPRLREMVAELDLDLVVNARPTTGEAGPRVLVEVIRARDGAHVWAHYLDALPGDRPAAETIAAAVADHVARMR